MKLADALNHITSTDKVHDKVMMLFGMKILIRILRGKIGANNNIEAIASALPDAIESNEFRSVYNHYKKSSFYDPNNTFLKLALTVLQLM